MLKKAETINYVPASFLVLKMPIKNVILNEKNKINNYMNYGDLK